MNLIKLVETFHSDEACRQYLEKLRWPNGPACPRCEEAEPNDLPNRDQYECRSCGFHFSVTCGTIMHDTHLPLSKWLMAVYLMVESKKGISANQLKRTLCVAYQTAWYLCQRIRTALYTPHALMTGVVEIDETYIGGRRKNVGMGYKKNKTLVVGAIERGGELRTRTVNRVTSPTLRKFINDHVCEDAEAIFTDERTAYKGIAPTAKRRHEWVTHSADEYVRGDVHTNSVENAWSLFKRSVVGAYHKISKKHLDLYLDEFEFRFNNRNNPYIFRDALKELLTSGNVEYKELVA